MENINKTFETAMHELEDILKLLSSNDITLDESIELYAKAAELLNLCNTKLKTAKTKITDIDEKMKDLEASNGI